MRVTNDISQISAEMLLNYLYPELQDKWIARHAGTFYRNYNNDHLTVSEQYNTVELARDGFLKLLPEGMLSDENELKGKDFLGKYNRLQQRRRLFLEAFLPFDTFAFRQRLHIERKVSELLDIKLDYVLRHIFGYDLTAETNPYVREIAVLLPYVSKMRADFSSIAKLLGNLFGCKTKLKIGRYSHIDSTRYWIPRVEYQLLIPHLSAADFQQLQTDIQPLQQFLAEWLMPAEVHCTITIKHHLQPQEAGNGLLLDYNTELITT